MIIPRKNIKQLYLLINSKADKKFLINTQYKLLKIKRQLEEEIDIYEEQLKLLNEYFERDEQGKVIFEEGYVKIKEGKEIDCMKLLNEINSTPATIQDIYFSIEELEPLDLTLKELELFEPFVKI